MFKKIIANLYFWGGILIFIALLCGVGYNFVTMLPQVISAVLQLLVVVVIGSTLIGTVFLLTHGWVWAMDNR